MNSSLFYKVMAWIIFVVGAIGSLALGQYLGIPDLTSKYAPKVFNAAVMFYGWISTFLTGAIFYGIGSIKSDQESIIARLGIKAKPKLEPAENAKFD